MTRCFIAIDIDGSLKGKITNLQRPLVDYGIKLVEPENLHITLRFLGELSEKEIETVNNVISDIAKKISPFDIHIKGCSVFPSLTHMRVVLLDTKGDELINLQKSVNCSLKQFKEYRSSLHLTIGRVKTAEYKKIADFVAKNRNAGIGKMCVNKIKLKSSVLTKKGPVYRNIKIFELESNDK